MNKLQKTLLLYALGLMVFSVMKVIGCSVISSLVVYIMITAAGFFQD